MLKPFAYGIADVTAGLVINLIGVLVDLAHCHRHGMSLGEFHLACSSSSSP
ncbi:hypothetical protein M2208_002000 [Bradyrhizobium elkanii]|nr:hypothetical protein [Bradyrhizobium elkanii]